MKELDFMKEKNISKTAAVFMLRTGSLFFLSVAIGVGLSACGSGPEKLTAEQKSIVKQVMLSSSIPFASANQRIKEGKKTLAPAPKTDVSPLSPKNAPNNTPTDVEADTDKDVSAFSALEMFGSTMNLTPNVEYGVAYSSANSSNINQTEKNLFSETFGRKIEDSNCEFKGDVSSGKSAYDNGSGSQSVSGDRCPMNLKFTISKQSGNGGMAFDMSFVILDSELKEMNDVDQYSFHGSISVVQNQNSGSVNGKFEGAIHSQAHGNIKQSLIADGSGSDGSGSVSMVYRVEFQSFVSELKIEYTVSNGSGDITYKLNGEEISKEEAGEYMGAAKASTL